MPTTRLNKPLRRTNAQSPYNVVQDVIISEEKLYREKNMRILQASVVACIRLVVIPSGLAIAGINFDTEKPVYVGSVVKVAGTTGSMYFNPFARLYSFVCPQFENENESSKHFRIKTIQRSSQTSRRLVRRPFSCQQLLKLQLVFLTGFGKFFFYLVRAHSTWPLFLHRSGRPGKVGEQIAQAKVQKNKQQQQQWTTIEHTGCRRVAIIRIAQADFLQGGSAERVQIIQMTLSFVQTHFLGFGLDVVTAERRKWHPYRATLG
ncbi:hypothetical protein T01_693 [Trichinella spiralis]|uniref:Uncharacterized protein n=1 Tax=Trichinella spiralis TaxID=6334 RepID=A0A0V1BPU7_TRISP|nr:hypothetical protein T01_693 [Trichinella spiralis]